MAVRSVQLMVDRGDLDAWKTPGGHRRISEASLERWVAKRQSALERSSDNTDDRQRQNKITSPAPRSSADATRLLLIEDSVHHQHLVTMLVKQRFPDIELHVADDGVVGLAMYGRIRPQILIVDILLPGIDGATLITSLRSHEQFSGSHLIVLTSLDESQREPYAFALTGVPVVHKPRLVSDLPSLIEQSLAPTERIGA